MTASTITVRPRNGIKLFDPASKAHLPAEGAEVESSIYWERRLLDGDAILVDQPALKDTVKPNKKGA
jgi:hypothetical protein